jgi:putative oxidoreductase
MSSNEKSKKQSTKAKTPAKKSSSASTKKTPAKKAVAKKAPVKKAPAKKVVASKSKSTTKTAAKKVSTTTAKKSPVAKKTVAAKKTPAKPTVSSTASAKAKAAPVAAKSSAVAAQESCEVMGCLCSMYQSSVAFAHKYLDPLLRFVIRLFMANIFFTSGILKLPAGFLGIGQGDWSTTLALFKYEHPVPYLDPEVAAYLGTTIEVAAPILLVFGFGGRVAALLLLCMTAVAEFTYQHSMEHAYWALLLAVIAFQGSGRLSIDYVIKKRHMHGASLCHAQK